MNINAKSLKINTFRHKNADSLPKIEIPLMRICFDVLCNLWVMNCRTEQITPKGTRRWTVNSWLRLQRACHSQVAGRPKWICLPSACVIARSECVPPETIRSLGFLLVAPWGRPYLQKLKSRTGVSRVAGIYLFDNGRSKRTADSIIGGPLNFFRPNFLAIPAHAEPLHTSRYETPGLPGLNAMRP